MVRWVGCLAAAVVGGAVTTAALIAIGVVEIEDRDKVTARTYSSDARGADLQGGESVAKSIYKRSSPSVVYVHAKTLRDSSEFELGPQGSRSEATGSGFVIETGGLILTNWHVVAQATEIEVALSEERSVPAQLLGLDSVTDLALLRVDTDLKPLELGSSAGLQIGDPTVSIGNPLGLDRTLTTGVVSALDRRLEAASGLAIEDAILTDAALNPGNSGGPLLDGAGRVVGVNSQISLDGTAIGFAIPIDTAKKVIPALKTDGRVKRPYLGVEASVGPEGLVVNGLGDGSPAQQAGVRTGDKLENIGGHPVRAMKDLGSVIASTQPGARIKLSVRTAGISRELTVTLGERPANPTGV